MDNVRDDVAKLLAADGIQPTPSPTPTTTTFKAGDLVQIKSGSTYYNSSTKVPNWVIADKWYIASINGASALIGQNESKKTNINSRVDVANLVLVTPSLEPTPTPTPTPAPSTTVKVGDYVKITKGATYYNSTKVVPEWVLADVWYVNSINGTNALLTTNKKGTSNINSRVETKYLTVETSSKTISAGSLVKIKPGSCYYNSTKKVPDWVIADSWYVSSIVGDRVLLMDNASHTNKLVSNLKMSDLIAV